MKKSCIKAYLFSKTDIEKAQNVKSMFIEY